MTIIFYKMAGEKIPFSSHFIVSEVMLDGK